MTTALRPPPPCACGTDHPPIPPPWNTGDWLDHALATGEMFVRPPQGDNHPFQIGYRGEPCRPPADLDATERWEWRRKWRHGNDQAEHDRHTAEGAR